VTLDGREGSSVNAWESETRKKRTKAEKDPGLEGMNRAHGAMEARAK